MNKPIGYNIPEGVDAESFLSDELIAMLGETFVGVTDAFGDDATLYKIDIGKIIESVQAGGLIISGQFVDKSDGEIFHFEINQDSNQLRYRSAGEFLDEVGLAGIRGGSSADEAEGDSTADLREKGQQLYDLLYEAVNDSDSEAGKSPFGTKLSKDLDYLAALSAAMYHAGITIEAQPLYAGLHSYAIKYTLGGLRIFSDVIGAMEGPEAAALANRWIDENGLGFAASFVKAFSAQRCEAMREQIQAGNQPAIEAIKSVLEEGLAMAMACTTDLIKTIAEAGDYEEGDVQVTLAAAIEEYCPIDNSDGYYVSINPRQLSTEWQEVVKRSGCAEDLSMQALGLPSDDTAGSEQPSSATGKARSAGDEPVGDDATTDDARIFYVNVGEGPSRNWDDCRLFGFLAAGGGRKWSKQLEKIKTGDTVIAYLKGYGYVGIGKVVTASTPATKFMVNGVPIRELPLINDTIRSIKRFSKENGEYLIGIDWEVAVPRENAAWKANAGLYTTALVCASLRNQAATVSFALDHLRQTQDIRSSNESPPSQESQVKWEEFIASLVGFLEFDSHKMESKELQERVAGLHKTCPANLFAVDQSKSVQKVISEEMNSRLIEVCTRIIEAGDEVLTLFLIGICRLGDATDKILEQLLDLVDDGINMNTLACEYAPHNVFEVNALVSLICWPEMPDWARAHLATRDTIGITSIDRDSFIEYLGNSEILGKETLLSICQDVKRSPSKYSDSFVKALRAFLTSDFVAISAYDSEDNLAMHLADLGEVCISDCKRALGLAAASKEEANNNMAHNVILERLTDNRLIERIRELNEADKEDLVRKTGYTIKLQDGTEELLYEDFYQALLEAKGMTSFTGNSLAPLQELKSDVQLLTSKSAIQSLTQETDDDSCDVESVLGRLTDSEWLSDDEFARFFIEVSANLFEESKVGDGSGVNLFGRGITYSFYPGTPIWDFWAKARKIKSVVDKLAGDMDCLPDSITSVFNIIPAAYAADVNNQSLDEWLANIPTEFSHEDNEFFYTLISITEEYSMYPLESIVRNIRSTTVLDELVFCSPELICDDLYLVDSGLLANPALSEEALTYLTSLFLCVKLPHGFTGKTEGDCRSVSVSEDDVCEFWLNYIEEIEALSHDEIAAQILRHPKCTQYLRSQIENP